MAKRIAHVSLEDSYLEILWLPSRDLLGIARISEMEENGQLNKINEGKAFTIRSINGESLSGYAYAHSNKFMLTLSGIDETVIADKTVTKPVFDAVFNIVREFDGKPIDRDIDIPIYSDKVKGGKRKTQRRKYHN